LIAFAFVVVLLYGWTAETLGSMAAITGAFLAGLMLSRSQVKERIESGIGTIAYAVFVPIFFVNVGLSANGQEMTIEYLWFALALIIVAILSKLFGAGLGAYIAGMSRRESLQLGAAMMSRGEVGLIVASVGIAEGWLGKDAFTAVIGVVIITTLITPISLRLLFTKKNEQNPKLDVGKGSEDE
jgi:Kef-type K+ transport system membrane component KefB